MTRVGRRVVLELAGMTSSTQLHESLRAAFGFPAYYGPDWVAFWDCIVDFGDAVDEIVLRGWLDLVACLPEDADLFMECLQDYRRQFRQGDLAIKMR